MPNRRIPREAFQALAIVGNAIAWLGVIIIIYGIVSTATQETWLPFELFIVPISATLALLAILLNAFVVSLTVERPAEPSPISRYVTAPVVILLCAVGIVSVWFQEMPISVVLGAGIVGLAWALIRVLPPYPEI